MSVPEKRDAETDHQADHELAHDDWDRRARKETPTQRLDRNWSSLLQELRVVQTGVQLLTGFLLTLPFQDSFMRMSGTIKGAYLITVVASIASTLLLVTPVALHRMLFRKRKLPFLVDTAHRLAGGGLALLGVSLAGVIFVIFAVVTSTTIAAVAAVAVVVGFVSLWLFLPLSQARE